MNYKLRISIYDSALESNGYRQPNYYYDKNDPTKFVNLTDYIIVGNIDEDNLDDTLDTATVRFEGLPFRKEFEPTSQFILDYLTEQINQYGELEFLPYRTLHLCVDNDAVEQPILSKDTFFTHTVSFIEAAVIAQQRAVDNIAVTYKLKDVTLNKVPTYDTDKVIVYNKNDIRYEKNGTHFGIWENIGIGSEHTYSTGHAFIWEKANWDVWEQFKENQEIPQGASYTTVELPIPMLACYSGTEPQEVDGVKLNQLYYANKNGYCSIDVIVTETALDGTTTEIVNDQINPNNNIADENWNSDVITGGASLENGEIISRFSAENFEPLSSATAVKSKVAEFDTGTFDPNSRVLSFNIYPNRSYNIIIKRHVFDTLETYPAYYSYCTYGFASRIGKRNVQTTNYFVNDNLPTITTAFNAVNEEETETIMFRSAPIATAYDLFNKCQITTQTYMKNNGIAVDETPKAFYLSPNNVQELRNTVIVESFYNQKNLWELFMEIGKYIHARPVINFGSDNRYLVDWKKYGQTEKSEKVGNRISIFNSRFVNEYVSACTSYVSNMVQLGGKIEEIVAPKSNSEDYLVYNDNAILITTKNIIELIKLEAINSEGTIKDLTQYVYEENIYQLLDVNNTTTPNKGIALYYELGTNQIKGLNYTRPVASTGEELYAIKNILGEAFEISGALRAAIKVNDYYFKISYRTKDTLRSDQMRPDLRKYLRNCKYDVAPIHTQFNNQTDIVVDADKFGNNVYGKLIRTGNTVISEVEWVSNIENLKHSGELYRILDNLYYVSKVTNTYYPNHIESAVEYSKDFNRLSQVIGIPSEPRFYEISEQSQIRREISINDYLILDTVSHETTEQSSLKLNAIKAHGLSYLQNLIMGQTHTYPKYALTYFKSDSDKTQLPANMGYLKKTIHPICCYSIENAFTMEWDMVDNFSAGDIVGDAEDNDGTGNVTDTAYRTLLPFQYPDIYGRCDLVDFAILDDATFTQAQVRKFPESPFERIIDFEPVNIDFSSCQALTELPLHTHGVGILKDNREALSFNININMLTGSDRFVLSNYLFSIQKGLSSQNVFVSGAIKLGILNKEISKVNANTITNADFEITDISVSAEIPIIDGVAQKYMVIKIGDALNGINLANAKAIVLYDTIANISGQINAGAKYFVMGRNISDLATGKDADWIISHASDNVFDNIQ